MDGWMDGGMEGWRDSRKKERRDEEPERTYLRLILATHAAPKRYLLDASINGRSPGWFVTRA